MPSRRFIDRSTDDRLVLTDDEIREVNDRLRALAKDDPRVIIAIGVMAITVNVVGVYGAMALLRYLVSLGVSQILAILICIAALAGLILPAWVVVVYRVYRRHVRRALVECGHPVCIGCGYLLDGVDGVVCPECGRAVTGAGG